MAGPNYAWQHRLTEWRHSPCLMKPVTLSMLVVMLIFSLATMILTLPTWFLGFMVAPVMARGTWLIEFLYPLPIARWGHLLILRWSQPKVPLADKAANYHSRTLEQRVEVVKGRVFVHPIPQLLDNLGYLVVCLPPDPAYPAKSTFGPSDTPLGNVSVTSQYHPDPHKIPKAPIVAFLVDCGDAETVAEQAQLIRDAHYPKYPSIRIQMVLSTHKHHDHTAGNEAIKSHPKLGQCLDHIVGGAVERVPGCTMHVADGDRLKLPICAKNDMNEVASVEVVSVPAHTRGSVVYMLRSTAKSTTDTVSPCFAFTGDTMFSGGGGVPFEAGSDREIDQGGYRDNAHGAVRAGVGSHAVERCFAEILVRGTMSNSSSPQSHPLDDPEKMQDQFLIFPGHEYTTELLSRQFAGTPGGSANDANKWKNFPPHVFFETVSELYVAMHRRSLPQATGKVLAAAPTTLRRELAINPHLRSLARRAELVVQAIRLWDAYFCKPKGPKDEEAAVMRIRQEVAKPKTSQTASNTTISHRRKSKKTPASESRWNMDHSDAAKSVFTTIYTADLDAMINDLARGKISADAAALQLEGLKTKLKEPVIRRRPIPGTLPSERVVFKGLIGFALLGSRPSAMTLSDSHAMKMPPPIVKDTSCILVSKKRLIAVLGHLGFLADNADGENLLSMINSLWREAFEYTNGTNIELTTAGSNDSNYNAVGKRDEDSNGTTSIQNEEDLDDVNDLIQLGTLKWILYGFPAKQPSWFSSFCMPCGMTAAEKDLQQRQGEKAQQEHPVKTSCMKRRHGELVRHDVITCKLCNNATGCPAFADEEDASALSETDRGGLPLPASVNPHHPTSSRIKAGKNFTANDDDSYVDSTYESEIEVSTITSLMAGDMHMLEATEEKVRI